MNMRNEILKQLLQYRTELFGFICAVVHNVHAAEDLFQEVSVIITEKADAGLHIRDFRAYAKEVARRRVLQYFREERAKKTVALPTPAMAELLGDLYVQHDPSPLELNEEYAALKACMDQLPEASVRVLRLRIIHEQSYAEISGRIRRSEAAMRMLVMRTRAALEQCMERRLNLNGTG